MANITAGNSLLVGARLTREEPQKMKNAHILLLYFLFSVLRQIGAEITQFATHRKLTLSFELFLFKNCSSGRNIIIKNCHKKVRKTEICAFSGSYCCSSARFRFSLFESYSGCILAFCRLQLYLEITFRCMEYMHFKDGDRYLYLYQGAVIFSKPNGPLGERSGHSKNNSRLYCFGL